jgi:hypothetical protein
LVRTLMLYKISNPNPPQTKRTLLPQSEIYLD